MRLLLQWLFKQLERCHSWVRGVTCLTKLLDRNDWEVHWTISLHSFLHVFPDYWRLMFLVPWGHYVQWSGLTRMILQIVFSRLHLSEWSSYSDVMPFCDDQGVFLTRFLRWGWYYRFEMAFLPLGWFHRSRRRLLKHLRMSFFVICGCNLGLSYVVRRPYNDVNGHDFDYWWCQIWRFLLLLLPQSFCEMLVHGVQTVHLGKLLLDEGYHLLTFLDFDSVYLFETFLRDVFVGRGVCHCHAWLVVDLRCRVLSPSLHIIIHKVVLYEVLLIKSVL